MLKENEDYYINADGLMVLTAAYLNQRGFCCGSGCKHCPYNYEKVPAQRRAYLLKARQDDEKEKSDARYHC